jgi:hypothetical protein
MTSFDHLNDGDKVGSVHLREHLESLNDSGPVIKLACTITTG